MNSNNPTVYYHATSYETAQKIVESGALLPLSGSVPRYLCASSVEKGATTINRQATDIIFKITIPEHLKSNWYEQGAGNGEWRTNLRVEIGFTTIKRFIAKKGSENKYINSTTESLNKLL